MSSPEKSKVKSRTLSFSATPEMEAEIKKIPQHTKWMGDVIAKALGFCPCCKQRTPEGGTVEVGEVANAAQA